MTRKLDILGTDAARRTVSRAEQQLQEQLDGIYNRARADAAPIIARLVELRTLRPPEPLVICLKCHGLVPCGCEVV